MSPGDIHQRLGTSVVVMTGGRSYWHGVGGDAAQRPSAQDGPPQRTVQPPWLAPALGGGADLWVLASPAAPLLAATLSPLLGWAFAPALSLALSGGRAQDLDPEIRLWGEGAAGSPSPLRPHTHGPAPPGSRKGGRWQDTEGEDPAWVVARLGWEAQSGLRSQGKPQCFSAIDL